MNRIIPSFSPFKTREEWKPWRVPSRVTSRHHWIIVRMIRRIPRIRSFGPYPWNHAAKPAVRFRAPRAPISGHGLCSTRWKGWRSIGIFFVAIFLLGRQMYSCIYLENFSGGREPLEELQSSALYFGHPANRLFSGSKIR